MTETQTMHFVTEGFLKTGGFLLALFVASILYGMVKAATGYDMLE